MCKREDQAEFLAHAARHGADLDVEIEFKAFGEFASAGADVYAADGADDLEGGVPVHPRPEAEIARHISDIAFDQRGVAPAIKPEDAGGSVGWAEKPQQYADGGGFACAVWPEKAVERAFADVDGDVFDAAPRAVGACEIVEIDDRHAVRISRWLGGCVCRGGIERLRASVGRWRLRVGVRAARRVCGVAAVR